MHTARNANDRRGFPESLGSRRNIPAIVSVTIPETLPRTLIPIRVSPAEEIRSRNRLSCQP
jgi:hypothetical protein